MEALKADLPTVVIYIRRWDVLCDLPMEGPWEESDVTVWGAGNCLLVVLATPDPAVTQIELRAYQGYPPDSNACNVWNSILAQCVHIGWLSDFEHKDGQEYERQKSYDSSWAKEIELYDADPAKYENEWKREQLIDGWSDYQGEKLLEPFLSLSLPARTDKDEAEYMKGVHQSIAEDWLKHLNEMQAARGGLGKRAAISYKTAGEAAEHLFEYLEVLKDDYYVSQGAGQWQDTQPTPTSAADTSQPAASAALGDGQAMQPPITSASGPFASKSEPNVIPLRREFESPVEFEVVRAAMVDAFRDQVSYERHDLDPGLCVFKFSYQADESLTNGDKEYLNPIAVEGEIRLRRLSGGKTRVEIWPYNHLNPEDDYYSTEFRDATVRILQEDGIPLKQCMPPQYPGPSMTGDAVQSTATETADTTPLVASAAPDKKQDEVSNNSTVRAKLSELIENGEWADLSQVNIKTLAQLSKDVFSRIDRLLEIQFGGDLIILSEQVDELYIRLLGLFRDLISTEGLEELKRAFPQELPESLHFVNPEDADIDWEYSVWPALNAYKGKLLLFCVGVRASQSDGECYKTMLEGVDKFLDSFQRDKREQTKKFWARVEKRAEVWKAQQEQKHDVTDTTQPLASAALGDGKGKGRNAEGILTLESRAKLRRNLDQYLNESELRDLCFDMGIDYDGLPGQSKKDKARELVAYCQRYSRLDDLVAKSRELHPNVSW